MSVWTHVYGVVVYDSNYLNVFPKPYDWRDGLKNEMETVSHFWQWGKTPYGSEGELELNFIQTDRGPAVIITGDLRDFGQDDIPKIHDWLNDRLNELNKSLDRNGMFLFLRGGYVICNVEYSNNYLIEYEWNGENSGFELKEIK